MTLPETQTILAGLRTIVVGEVDAPIVIVMCHGYSMLPEELSPFAHTLGVSAQWFFPEGVVDAEPEPGVLRGRSWWKTDPVKRVSARASGPRDFANLQPADLPQARARFSAWLDEVLRLARRRPVIVGGFSSGGMLVLDTQLHAPRPLAALVLLSSTRIAFTQQKPLLSGLAGLPVLITHGRADDELAFAAGQALRDAAQAGGADVNWLAFEGGHEIPLVVWRGLRQFLRRF
ncbi:MAG TPA: hypothetical protein VN043_07860 [Rhodanobacter sp.]|nr:hypothetical protein [Rhodanobacter sp.]